MTGLREWLLRTRVGAITLALLCAYLINNFVGLVLLPLRYYSVSAITEAYYQQFEGIVYRDALVSSFVADVAELIVTLGVIYLLARWLFGPDILKNVSKENIQRD